MSVRLRLALLALCAPTFAFSAATARAQSVSDSTATVVTNTNNATGPSLQSLPVGVQRQAAPMESRSDMLAARQSAGVGQAGAMMIVGGAAILVGALIGGDPGTVIMVGGAVVGLIGLYKYLQ